MKKNALEFPHSPVLHEDGVRRSGVCLLSVVWANTPCRNLKYADSSVSSLVPLQVY